MIKALLQKFKRSKIKSAPHWRTYIHYPNMPLQERKKKIIEIINSMHAEYVLERDTLPEVVDCIIDIRKELDELSQKITAQTIKEARDYLEVNTLTADESMGGKVLSVTIIDTPPNGDDYHNGYNAIKHVGE